MKNFTSVPTKSVEEIIKLLLSIRYDRIFYRVRIQLEIEKSLI